MFLSQNLAKEQRLELNCRNKKSEKYKLLFSVVMFTD